MMLYDKISIRRGPINNENKHVNSDNNKHLKTITKRNRRGFSVFILLIVLVAMVPITIEFDTMSVGTAMISTAASNATTTSATSNNNNNNQDHQREDDDEQGDGRSLSTKTTVSSSMGRSFGIVIFLLTSTTALSLMIRHKQRQLNHQSSSPVAASAFLSSLNMIQMYVIAPIILHVPQFLVAGDDMRDHRLFLMKLIVGSISEGIFFLYIISYCLSYMSFVKDRIILLQKNNHSSRSPILLPLLLQRLLMITSFTLFMLFSIFICLLGDYTYQSLMGIGQQADMWMINSGISNVKQYIQNILFAGNQDNVIGAGPVTRSAILCVICILVSVCMFHQGKMAPYQISSATPYYKIQQEGGEQETDDEATRLSLLPPQPRKRQQQQFRQHQGRHTSAIVYLGSIISLSVIYSTGIGYVPILHPCLCYIGATYLFEPEDANIQIASVTENAKDALTSQHDHREGPPPNLIYIISDSLSSAYILHHPSGRKVTEFFQSLFRENDDFYSLQHMRSISGDTIDDVTALMSGCTPITTKSTTRLPTNSSSDINGQTIARSRSIGTEFKRMGYATASFSSSRVDLKATKWYMLENFFKANMDLLIEPIALNHKLVSDGNADDRELLRYFEDWVVEKTATTATATKNNTDNTNMQQNQGQPLYGQMYLTNTHWPFGVKLSGRFNNHTRSKFKGVVTSKYFKSLELFDVQLKGVFDILSKTGQLNNTIIIGSGDHGVYPFEGGLRSAYTNHIILNPLSYMYIPPHLFPSNEAREIFRTNTINKTTSILDLFPTIQNILYGGSNEETSQIRIDSLAANLMSKDDQEHCMTGIDLMSTVIPDNRLALQWNTMTGGNHLALSGTRFGLYKSLYQNSDFCTMEYDDVYSEFPKGPCSNIDRDEHDLTEAERGYWKFALQHDNISSSMLSSAVMNSKVLDKFREELGINSNYPIDVNESSAS